MGLCGCSRNRRRWILPGGWCLQNQHCVPKGKEAIRLSLREFVRLQNRLPPCEGAHEHDQRGLGQMEIGDHRVHQGEAKAWQDKEVGLARVGRNPWKSSKIRMARRRLEG